MKVIRIIIAISFLFLLSENIALAKAKMSPGTIEAVALTVGLTISPVVIGLAYLHIKSSGEADNLSTESAKQKMIFTKEAQSHYLDRVMIFYSNNGEEKFISIGVKF